jgi:hypothetical protein
MGRFVKHASCSVCGSSDAKAVYEDGSSHCFSCGHTIPSEEYRAKYKHQVKSFEKEVQMEMEPKQTKPALTEEENQTIKQATTIDGNGFRGIRNEIYKHFGVRHLYSSSGELLEQYYPCTQDGQLVGYKIRELPKTFYSKGRTGAECDLFGQFRFMRGGKYVLLVEGEVDQLSAYQMLKDYNSSKGNDYETAVVSPTTGANSHKQIAAQYKFFDSFDNIIICFDNDKAGKDALQKIIPVLPKGKVRVMQMELKDANEYLQSGRQREFVRAFYESKPYVPVGVLGSSQLYDRILEQAHTPKVPFPPFMRRLNDMLVGGLPLGHIVNIAAGTGLGKTSFINEMVYYWIFNSPHKIGIVSMELDAGQYGELILGRHLSRKLALIPDEQKKLEYLTSEKVKNKANELFFTKDGKDRFYLLDNRDGSIEEIQNTIEELVISCGCRIIILDPLQDILDGLTIDEQAVFMKWCKGLIKSHNVTMILINHVRKASGSSGNSAKGDSFTEEEIQGSSTIIKSASVNILLSRNKYAEDEVERNTTRIMLSKNRICGLTGPAGEVYYENETNTLWDKEVYFSTTTETPQDIQSES